MELQYIKCGEYNQSRGVETCPYNDGCQCDRYQRKACNLCGWNPKVSQRRAEKLLRKGCAV